MEPCLIAAEAKKHIFCEVPLALELRDTDRLAMMAERNKLVVAPGCQTPFHPLFKQFKSWLDDAAFGKPLAFLADFGQYLPDWHPYEDYRKFYAADQAMGGGNLDVVAQEMSTLSWLLGDRFTSLYCRGSHLSTLEIQASDCWQIIANTERGTALTAHFDMIQRAGRFGIKSISETGTIELDLVAGTIRRFLSTTKQWETRTTPQGFVHEQCYIDEIALFIECINGQGRWHNPLPVAIDIVRFLQGMLRSTRENQSIKP
jgi:predicted dehydrogenase